LLGRSGNRWCSIWWLRLPVVKWNSGRPSTLLEPSSCRRCHSAALFHYLRLRRRRLWVRGFTVVYCR